MNKTSLGAGAAAIALAVAGGAWHWTRFSARTDASVASTGRGVEAAHVALPPVLPAPSEAAPEEDFQSIAAFGEWAEAWARAGAEERAAMTAEGARLAEARRPAFKRLIASDPERALEQAVPRVIRQDLPEEIVAWLETPVSTRGNLNVYRGRPEEGAVLPPETELTLRYLETLEGQSYKARVFGPLLAASSQADVAVRGVAIDRELAIAPSPVRRLEAGERVPEGVEVEQTCPVSGETTPVEVTAEDPLVAEADAPAVEAAGRMILLCNGSHVTVFDESYSRENAIQPGVIRVPNLHGPPQASGGPGGAQNIQDAFPGSADAEAIGNFRALYIRVTYPDQNRAPNTEESAYKDMANVSRYYLESSYSRMSTTTVVTPLLTLPNTKEWYIEKDDEVDGLGLVHSHARRAARLLGYDSGQYTVTIVRVNGGPRLSGISWGGGDSVWVSWDGMDVLNHECGHSLGRNHANFWNTEGRSAIGDGANQEYGNSFDVMGGGGGFAAHYNTISKRALGWIPAANAHELPAGESGTFRIYAYDHLTLDEGKRYYLRVPRDGRRFYHLEFHEAYGAASSSSRALQNAALLIWHWSDLGNAGHLIDTTPGSPNGKRDGGIEVGRTFSDPGAALHFTVVGKNATVPPSLDITVNRGDFPGNRPPVFELAASAENVAVGVSLTFTAAASDPDGDVLAYHWDFGDGYFSENTASLTRGFAESRQYTVVCTVSDMKGGVARKIHTFTAGNTSRIALQGTVRAGGRPLSGVLISNGSAATLTDDEGRYALPNLSVGSSHTLTAQLYGHSFTPQFTNPIAATAAAAADWAAARDVEVSLSAGNDATEGGGSGSFVLARTGPTAAALTVNVLSASGTAERSVDYNLTPNYVDDGRYRTFTIPAGQASLTVNVAPVNDTAAEGPETVMLSLVERAGYIAAANATATITLHDNDTELPQVSLASSNREAREGPSARPAAFTLTRTGPATGALTVPLTFAGSASAADYTGRTSPVVIPEGQASITVPIVPVDDALAEGTETITVTLASNAAYVRHASERSVELQLLDDDIPVVTLTAAQPEALEEGRVPAMLMVHRTGPVAAPLKVWYGLSGTALHGADYTPLPAEITIPAGQNSVPLMINPVDDGHGEGDETVRVRLTTFNGTYLVSEAAEATATIRDNADPPLITVGSTDSVCAEPSDTGKLTFQLRGTKSGPTTVRYTVSGTAAPGTDYTALSGSVVIPAPVNGAAQTDVTITPRNDSLKEDVETIIVTLTPDPAYVFLNDGAATVWLRDDDQVTVNISAGKDAPAEASSPTASHFYIGRSNAAAEEVTSGALTVDYAISGTAENGVDYAMLSGQATIPSGEPGVTVVVTPVNDSVLEGVETITLTVSPSPNYGLGVASATLAMTDDEGATSGSARNVRFPSTTGSTTESSTGADGPFRTVAVQLSAAAASPVSVRYRSGGGSTAWADGIDWTLVDPATNEPITTGVLAFAPGETTAAIKLRLIDDGLVEHDEKIVLELFEAVNARLSGTAATHTLTVRDNLSANPAPRVFFAAASSAVRETDAAAPGLMVVLDRASAAPVNVAVQVTGGSAEEDADFSLGSPTLTFAAGETARWIVLSPVNDTLAEGDETVVLTLNSPSGAELGAAASHTLFLRDDDAPTIDVAVYDPDAWEPAKAGAFILTRSGVLPAGDLLLRYTVGGTAASGSDFTPLTGTVTLPAGQTSVVVSVTPLDDDDSEPDETIVLTLAPGAGYSVGGNDQAVVTLRDDDVAPFITLLSPANFTAAIPPGVGLVMDGRVGKPAPGATLPATAAWSKVSGPGEVTFGDASRVATTAAFDAPGAYVLRLTATADGRSASREISVAAGVPADTPAAAASDVGGAVVSGSWSRAGGVFTLSGAGSGLSSSGTADGFFFFAAPRTGNFDLRVRVMSLDDPGGSDSTRFGLMVRASEAADAPYAFTCYRGSGGHGFNYRRVAGNAAEASQGSTARPLPAWLRLVRSGNTISAYYGDNGTNWSQRGSSQSIPNLGASPLVGLAVTSAVPTQAATVVFSDLNFELHPNIGPLVSAGADASGSNPFALAGSSSDDGLPTGSSLKLRWQKASGPGRISFSPLGAASSSATLNASGAHTVRLVADDGGIATFADAVLTLTGDPGLPPLEAWRLAQFAGDAGDSSIAGNHADPDHDGLPNLLEYALGQPPRQFSRAFMQASLSDGKFHLVFARDTSVPDVSLVLEASTDLGGWLPPAGVETEVLSTEGTLQTLKYSVPATPGVRYFRLRAVP